MAETSRPYHHGDLRAALVDEALALARREGPTGVSLREATRRVGVTPSAAYRHFRDRAHLLEAVSRVIQERMGRRMRGRMRAPQDAGPQERALGRLRGVGLGYIAFALDEPGWFETAFFGSLREEPTAPDGPAGQGGVAADPPGGTAESGAPAPPLPPPFALLVDALDECERAGALAPERRQGAEFVCWSAVHGCAELVLHGPLRDAPRTLVRQIAERTVEDIITGIRCAV